MRHHRWWRWKRRLILLVLVVELLRRQRWRWKVLSLYCLICHRRRGDVTTGIRWRDRAISSSIHHLRSPIAGWRRGRRRRRSRERHVRSNHYKRRSTLLQKQTPLYARVPMDVFYTTVSLYAGTGSAAAMSTPSFLSRCTQLLRQN